METPVKTVKVTVNLPQDVVEALRDMAKTSGTVTQALKDSVALKAYIDQEARAKSKVLIERPDRSVRELVVLR